MKTQNEIRGKFEKLDEIADKLEHLFFEDGFYFRKYDDADSDEYFVNGAWYAFQEKQKKIDKVLAIMGYNLGKDDFENMRCPDYQTMLNTLIEIKELLK